MLWDYYEIQPLLRLEKLYSFFHTHYAYGYRFEGEMHNFWECVYVHRGQLVAISDERVIPLSQGSLAIHKPMELHGFYVDSLEGADVTIFSFGAWGPRLDMLRNQVFSLDAAQQQQIQGLLSLAQKTATEKASPHEAPHWQYLSPCSKKPVYGQQLANLMENLLLSLSDNGHVVDHTALYDAGVFRTAVDFMQDNIHQKLSLAQIAQHCNVSISSLKRVFEKYAGMGVHKYFLSMKIQTADALLKSGASVGQVAEKLGFPSQSNFSAAFKRETGSCPSALKTK